ALALAMACAAPRGESAAPAVALGRAAAESSAPAAPAARVALKTAYTTASAPMAPIWLAIEGGGFAEQGFDAELTLVGPGQAILGALTSEETPIVMAGANQVLEANLQGGQYVILGSAIPYMTTSVFVVPSVQRPEDLRGLAVGVSNFGATTHVALKVALE